MGNLILKSKHRLLCGDSTKWEDVERVLGGDKPLLMVTDPPYGVEYDPEWREDYDGRWNYAKGVVENDDKADWLEAYKLFPGDVAYVWHAGRHAKTVQQNLEDAGLVMRSQIIWNKPVFVFSRGHYHWKHEPCWYAVRPGTSAKWNGDRTQSTVWDIDGLGVAKQSIDEQDERTPHSTQKPVECMARPIRNHGEAGDGVYEPFSGSGTTFVAAQNLNRKCYGIEISPAYCAVILERMATAFPSLTIVIGV